MEMNRKALVKNIYSVVDFEKSVCTDKIKPDCLYFRPFGNKRGGSVFIDRRVSEIIESKSGDFELIGTKDNIISLRNRDDMVTIDVFHKELTCRIRTLNPNFLKLLFKLCKNQVTSGEVEAILDRQWDRVQKLDFNPIHKHVFKLNEEHMFLSFLDEHKIKYDTMIELVDIIIKSEIKTLEPSFDLYNKVNLFDLYKEFKPYFDGGIIRLDNRPIINKFLTRVKLFGNGGLCLVVPHQGREILYHQLIKSLNVLSKHSRPDLSYETINKLKERKIFKVTSVEEDHDKSPLYNEVAVSGDYFVELMSNRENYLLDLLGTNGIEAFATPKLLVSFVHSIDYYLMFMDSETNTYNRVISVDHSLKDKEFKIIYEGMYRFN